MKNDPAEPVEFYVLGSNSGGVLGLNDTVPRSSPHQLPGTQWETFYSSWNVSRATKTDGTLWTWGSNTYGRLGQNDTVPRSSPHQLPGTQWSSDMSYSFGNDTSSSLTKTDGTLWSWGYNNSGQLGQNDIVPRSSPVQLPGTQWAKARGNSQRILWFIKNDGTLWGSGYFYAGTSGLNILTIRYSSPVQVPGNQWVDIGGGPNVVLALKSNNTLWSWGYDSGGVLGLNTNSGIDRSSPTQIPGTEWSQILVGPANNLGGIKSDNTLWLWGENNRGQLGQNNTVSRSSPTQVPGTQWLQGDLTENDTTGFFLKTDGTLWALGENGSGRFGENVATSYSSPVQIPGSSWREVKSLQSSIQLRKQ
jgi:alpha-tubulin suppressor-like RCC1 family protein